MGIQIRLQPYHKEHSHLLKDIPAMEDYNLTLPLIQI